MGPVHRRLCRFVAVKGAAVSFVFDEQSLYLFACLPFMYGDTKRTEDGRNVVAGRAASHVRTRPLNKEA